MQGMNDNNPIQGITIEPYTIIRDVLKQWVIIVTLAVSAALLTYIYVNLSYNPTYTVSSTYVVTQKGEGYAYGDLASAQQAAKKMEQILGSSILQKKVCEDLGLFSFPGEGKAEVIPETNLITIQMTAGSPEMAFKLLESTMENYTLVSDYMLGNVVMEVLENPNIPTGPNEYLNTKGPMKKAFVGTAAVLVLLFAVLSYLRDTVRTEKDVKNKLDISLLGAVHHENRFKTVKAFIYRPKGSILVTNSATSFRYVETLRKTVMKIKNKMDDKEAKVLLVSSVLENEGKSTLAANIALILAQESKRVALIDCDFRKPAQYKIFDCQNEKIGEFGEAVCGREITGPLVRREEHTGLFQLMGTKVYPDSTEMLGSPRFYKMLDFFREKMDYVILDTSPVALVADAEDLAEVADASVLVVRQHWADTREVNDAADILNGGDDKLLGCILNDLRDSLGETMGQYGGGYGYGYGYGGYGAGHGKIDRQ